MSIATLYDKVRMLSSNLMAKKSYPGYRMTERSRAAWDKLEREKMKSQKEWEAMEREEHRISVVVQKTRRMIETAHTEYEYAKAQHKNNIKIFTELTLNWSPQRVLSKHKDFKRLCDALNDDKVWKMLSRKERAFIADAVRLK